MAIPQYHTAYNNTAYNNTAFSSSIFHIAYPVKVISPVHCVSGNCQIRFRISRRRAHEAILMDYRAAQARLKLSQTGIDRKICQVTVGLE